LGSEKTKGEEQDVQNSKGKLQTAEASAIPIEGCTDPASAFSNDGIEDIIYLA
jgi:hypothetical protein